MALVLVFNCAWSLECHAAVGVVYEINDQYPYAVAPFGQMFESSHRPVYYTLQEEAFS